MKTNKSFTKRIKITRKGKQLTRKPGFNHFNAKQTRVKQLGGKRSQAIVIPVKVRSRAIPYN